MFPFVDSHCHLDRYENLQEVLQRAKNQNVQKFLSIGVNRENSALVADLIEAHENVYGSCGLHPCDVEKDFISSSCNTLEAYEENLIHWLKGATKKKKILALGETGLDFFKYHHPSGQGEKTHGFCPKDLQKTALKAHFHVARDLDMPLVIHMRQSEEDFLQLLNLWQGLYGSVRGVMHCFTGSLTCGQEVLKWPGWYLSVSGILTFPNAQDLRQTLQCFSLENLLLETDAPWLTPQNHRGKVNEPQFLVETAKKLSEVLNCSLEEVAKATRKNFHDLFFKGKDFYH